MMRATLTIIVAATAFAGPLQAVTFESGDAQTTLVELYTSEGCSSCPPAEARMAKLRDDPGLWKQFVPVEFHVDYWDNLGWKDRFASSAFTQRQRTYAARWRSSSVYTPAFFQNGREGSDPTPPAKPGRLRVEVNAGGQVIVTYQPTNPSVRELVVEAAPLASGVTSDVRHGENAGRHLAHEFVALDLLHGPMQRRDGAWSATLALPTDDGSRSRAGGLGPHGGRPTALQAAGGWLKK